jgi:putative thiamine transport system permease protein
MAKTPATAWIVRAVVSALLALPILYAALASVAPALSARAWADALATPGLFRAWATSALVATTSTLVAAALAWHAAARWAQPDVRRSQRHERASRRARAWLGPMLAIPHAAFAVGVMVLLAPAGVVARVLGQVLDWTAPPDSRLLVDSPLALVVVLVLKELPFLLWNALSTLRRPDVQLALTAADRQAALLGHAPTRRWWLVHAPMHAPKLAWPVLAVLAYGLAVVDVPLVTGPTLPPPLAVLAWEAIADADPARQDAGAAMAWLLVAGLVGLAFVLAGIARWIEWLAVRWATQGAAVHAHVQRRSDPRLLGSGASTSLGTGPSTLLRTGPSTLLRTGPSTLLRTGPSTLVGTGLAWNALLLAYAAVGVALVLASVAGPWPFPRLAPQVWTLDAWQRALAGASRIVDSFLLAGVAATLGVLLTMAWLAATPARWDRASVAAAMSTVLLPQLLLSIGLYELSLRVRLDATHAGLLWATLLFASAYALLVMAGPWRALDRRYLDTARLLGHGPWSRLVRVQLPLMRAPLAAAWAVAFAVAMAQFLPTQLIGAGRITTLATEAVTLASAGQRSVAAATALLLAALPCVVFVLAARVRVDAASSTR